MVKSKVLVFLAILMLALVGCEKVEQEQLTVYSFSGSEGCPGLNNGITDNRHTGAVPFPSVASGGSVPSNVADGLAATIGADGGEAVADLVIIGVISVISLPLDILKLQRPALLRNGLGQVIGVGAG